MPEAPDPVIDDNIRCVTQAIELLSELPPDRYAAKGEASLGASIGGHIRHNIDHYRSFLRQAEAGRIDYDDRSREATIENDPAAAYQRLHGIRCALERFAGADLDRAVEVKMDCGCSGEWSRSTLRRELQFLLSHTVHHYAIIAMMCRSAGIEMPEGFGVAPSTLKYRASLADSPAAAR